MQNKYDVLNTIHDKDTKTEISKIFDKADDAYTNNKISITHFLSPTFVSKTLELIDYDDLKICVYGGYENAERCICSFSPKNTVVKNDDYMIDILKITYNQKYSKELKHSDFLGSLMGLSINRDYIGDIIVEESLAYIFVCSKMSNFIIDNLQKVGRTNVKIEKCTTELDLFQKELDEIKTSVTSLRIDVILSKIFNLSRNEVKDLINGGKVFLNWIEISDSSKIVKDNDIITLRGYGRIKYLESTGVSKKGKIIIKYLKY